LQRIGAGESVYLQCWANPKIPHLAFRSVRGGFVRRRTLKFLCKCVQGLRELLDRFELAQQQRVDFLIGGGIDIPVTPKIAIRPVQFDYLLTRFGNAFTAGNNNQSNFRYQAGVQFRF
jgi:hypothetical protein